MTEHKLSDPGAARLLLGGRLAVNFANSPSLPGVPAREPSWEELVAFLEKNSGRLDDDARRRTHTNPLRTLDSKNPAVQEVLASAPSLAEHLGDASRAHFEGVKRLLGAAGVEFSINPKLVRGLDYYNLTVFEWISDRLGAQGTVCGGGRYDGLFELIGGKPAPAAGFAMGNERLIALLLEGERSSAPGREAPHAYVVFQGEGTAEYAFALAEELRSARFRIVLHAGGGSFKSQMKKADSSGALHALIVGEDELRANAVAFKFLRKDAEQLRVKRGLLKQTLSEALAQQKG